MTTPTNLHAVSLATSPQEFTFLMKEFVDVIYRHARLTGFNFTGNLPLPAGAIAEPASDVCGPVRFAYLCALAEHLAEMAGINPPSWSESPAGFLDQPSFQGGHNARDVMLAQTPAAFRRRLVFSGPVLLKLETLRAIHT